MFQGREYIMQQDKNNQDAATSEGRSPKRVAASPPLRWSAGAKADAVLRVLRGESIEQVSRECRISAAELIQWRDEFIEGGKHALKTKPGDLTEDRLKQAHAKIGDLSMRLEIAETYFKKKGVHPWKK
jgi:transposase-like protein